jgi:hypothetical protein
LNSHDNYTLSFKIKFPDAASRNTEPWNFVLNLDEDETHSVQFVWDATDNKPSYKMVFGHAVVGKNTVRLDEFLRENLKVIDVNNKAAFYTCQIEMFRNLSGNMCLKEIRFDNNRVPILSSGGEIEIDIKKLKIESFYARMRSSLNKHKDAEGAEVKIKELTINFPQRLNKSNDPLPNFTGTVDYSKNFIQNKVKLSFFSISNSNYTRDDPNDSKSHLGSYPKMDQDSLKHFFIQKIGLIDSKNFHHKNELKKEQLKPEKLFPIEQLGDINFIHFSGHGNSFNNKNYWLPTDYRPKMINERLNQSNILNKTTSNSNYESSLNSFNEYLDEQALSVEKLIKYLDTLGGGRRIYFILSDACRDYKDLNQVNRGSTGISAVSFSNSVILTSDSSTLNHSLFVIGFPVDAGSETANSNSFTQHIVNKWNFVNDFWSDRISLFFTYEWSNGNKSTISESKVINKIDPYFKIYDNIRFKEMYTYFLNNDYFKRQ